MGMRNIIFSTDEVREFFALHKDPEFRKLPEDEIWRMAHENCYQYMEDECAYNLDVDVPGEIVLTGNLVRWNGSGRAHKFLGTSNIGKAYRAAMASFDGDNTFTAYTEDGKTYLEQTGHDNPTNPSMIEFRMVKSDVNPDELSSNDLYEKTLPITAYVNDVYGWQPAIA